MAKKQAKRREFKIGSWHGKNNYVCEYCGWSTLHLDKMHKHIEAEHREKPIRKRVEVPIYDRFGNIVKYREE